MKQNAELTWKKKRKEKLSGVLVAGLLPETTWEKTEMCNGNFN